MSFHPWPIPPSERTLHVIGDLHFDVLNESPLSKGRSAKILADVPRVVLPSRIVQIGDLKNEASPAAFGVPFLESLLALGVPVTTICGNHDIWQNEATVTSWAEHMGLTLVPTPPEGLPHGNYLIDTPLFRLIFLGPSAMETLIVPSGLEATAEAGGGTFAAAKYFWKVTGLSNTGETTGSAEATATIALNGNGKLKWTLPSGTIACKVYRSTVTGEEKTTPALVAEVGEGLNKYTDTGIAVKAGAVPAVNTAVDRLTINLTAATTTWLAASLEATSKPCIIMCHQSLENTHPGGGSINGTGIGFSVQPNALIKTILGEHANAKAWVSGHTHAPTDHKEQVMSYEVGGRKIACINVSSPAYTGTTFNPLSAIRSCYITSYLDAAVPHIEVRTRDHGGGIWAPFNNGELVNTITVG